MDGPRIWTVHAEEWGLEPRQFVKVQVNVPTWTAEGSLPGFADEPGCGCANAWIEAEVPAGELHYADGHRTLIIGGQPSTR